MFLGRPNTAWTTAFAGVVNAIVLLGVVHLDVMQLAGVNVAFAGLIGLFAIQTPTVNAGDNVNVTTPAGQPNAKATLDITPGNQVTATTIGNGS